MIQILPKQLTDSSLFNQIVSAFETVFDKLIEYTRKSKEPRRVLVSYNEGSEYYTVCQERV